MQPVFAMLKGVNIKSVSERFGICLSTLYQLRRRAIANRPPRNRKSNRKENFHLEPAADGQKNKAVGSSQHHPTLSSYRNS